MKKAFFVLFLILLASTLSFGQIKDFKKELIGTWDAEIYNSVEATGQLIAANSDAKAKMVFTANRVVLSGKLNWKGSWSVLETDDEDGHRYHLQILWDNPENPEDVVNLTVVSNEAATGVIVKGIWYDPIAIEMMIGLKRAVKKK